MAPIDLLAALFVVLAWGCNFVVIKAGVGQLPPFLMGALRFSLAAFPAILFVRRPRVPWRPLLAYGVMNWVLQIGLLYLAIQKGMPSGLAAVVLQAQAFFTLIFAVWFLREAWHAHQILGLTLASTGMAFIGAAHHQGMPLLGFLLTLAAALAWGFGNIALRRIGRDEPGVDMFAFTVWASLIPILPLLVPVVGLSVAWLAYGERMGFQQQAGVFLVLAGLSIHGLGGRFHGRAPALILASETVVEP